MWSTIQMSLVDNAVTVANANLLTAIGDEQVTDAIDNDQIVVLGAKDEETTVSVDFEELAAIELPVPVVRHGMP